MHTVWPPARPDAGGVRHHRTGRALIKGARATLHWEILMRRGKLVLRTTLVATMLSSGLVSALIYIGSGAVEPAAAQAQQRNGSATPAFARGMIDALRRARQFPNPNRDVQQAPRIIPKTDVEDDPSGQIGSFQPNGATITANNAFFANLGTNGRTCFSCHQPQNGWGISAEDVSDTFQKSNGTAPIFRLVDGAVCPTADVKTLQARKQAYQLLTDKGLIRIGLPLPDNVEFEVTSVDDPYNCNTNPVTGLTSPTTGIVSVYRRPLPSTNVGFLSAIMWDGREPSLENQAVDATLGHAEADHPPTAEQVAQIVAFQRGIFTAQLADDVAGRLDRNNATGGPVALSLELANFFIGINDPLGGNPRNIPFTPEVFNLYQAWLGPQQVASANPNATGAAAQGGV